MVMYDLYLSFMIVYGPECSCMVLCGPVSSCFVLYGLVSGLALQILAWGGLVPPIGGRHMGGGDKGPMGGDRRVIRDKILRCL